MVRGFFLILSFLFTPVAQGQGPLSEAGAVVLVVKPLTKVTRNIGFSRAHIHSLVKRALRNELIGIVDDSAETLLTLRAHALPPTVVTVKVNAIKKRNGTGFVGGVKILVSERAALLRDPGKDQFINSFQFSANWADSTPIGMRKGLEHQLKVGLTKLTPQEPAPRRFKNPKPPKTTFVAMPK